MHRGTYSVAAAAVAVVCVAVAAGAATSAVRTQPDAQFAASFVSSGTTAVDATTQRVSCYRPEVAYFDGLPAEEGYPNGGGTVCPGATTGESLGPYPTQDAVGAANPPMLVKDHSESDIRVDPTNASHLIGMSKWFVNAEGYNHLVGFYESFDGGVTWPTQGHVPGYEGWTDNTDPVGSFDRYGNFYSLMLPYNFAYAKSGTHVFNNGSNQTNPTVPPEAISVSVRPHGSGGPNDWITMHNGRPDYVATAKNANTSDPDKQWITIDTNPNSPCRDTVYAMWTIFVFNPSYVFVATAHANPDGTHSDWSTPLALPTRAGKPWDSYLLPHVAPDGTVYTTITNGPPQQGFSHADIDLVSSKDCGRTWEGPFTVTQGINVPTYQNTTFREGIVNTFAVGKTASGKTSTSVSGNAYPLYVSYEDGSSGLSNVYLIASYDGGLRWTAPVRVNDNAGATEALQPNLSVTPTGRVAVAFYDRRLPCPLAGTPEATAAGLQFDPNHPYGASNYCINTAIQFYDAALTPLGYNLRLSPHTWDPQLSAPHSGCICGSTTFIGDYFGVDASAAATYTTSVSTYNDGTNPSNYQQQIVTATPTP
jgi:hypothetical protein